jgi:leucyl/phenylalanyl-tRNA--protein transferase
MLRDMVTDAGQAVALYASGFFPMDEPGADELPWWTADPRAVLDLDQEGLERVRRAVRRSVRAAGNGLVLQRDGAFEEVLERCGRPRHDDDGVWLTPRLAGLYRALRETGHATTFELWDGPELVAGIVGVRVGAAAMLESMCHTRPHAGNVCLLRTLEALAREGFTLCDVQLANEHTRRIGAREIPRAEYERRLRDAVRRAPT